METIETALTEDINYEELSKENIDEISQLRKLLSDHLGDNPCFMRSSEEEFHLSCFMRSSEEEFHL